MHHRSNRGDVLGSKEFHSVSFAQENELQDFLQENKHLSLQLYNSGHKASKYEQVSKNGAALMCY